MELEILFRELVETIRAKDPSRLHQPHRLRDIQYGLIPYRHVRDSLDLSCSEDHEMLLLRMCNGEAGFFEISDTDASHALRAEAEGINPDLTLLQVYGEVEVLLAGAAIERVLSGPAAQRATEFAPRPEEDTEEAATFAPANVISFSSRDEALPMPPPVPEPTILPSYLRDPASESEPDSPQAESRPDSISAEEPGPETAQPEPVPASRSTPPPFDMLPPEPAAAQCDFCGGNLPAGREVSFCPHCGQNLATIRCARCSAELEWGWRHCISCGQAVPDV